jgi:branched-chain amino acid transport system permease protein
MKDSPAGCATVGMSLTTTKLIVFSLSAAIAGVGGYLFACWKGSVGVDDYSLLTGALAMLPVLLLAVVGGITAVSGALLGALILVALPQIAEAYPSLTNLMILLPGLVGISLARNPDGLVADLSRLTRVVRDRYEARTSAADDAVLAPRAARVRARPPEAVGLGRRAASPEDLSALEAGLGIVREDCGVVA